MNMLMNILLSLCANSKWQHLKKYIYIIIFFFFLFVPPVQEIANHMEKDTETYEVVQEAIDTMQRVAWHINDMKRKHEHAVRLQVQRALSHTLKLRLNLSINHYMDDV